MKIFSLLSLLMPWVLMFKFSTTEDLEFIIYELLMSYRFLLKQDSNPKLFILILAFYSIKKSSCESFVSKSELEVKDCCA